MTCKSKMSDRNSAMTSARLESMANPVSCKLTDCGIVGETLNFLSRVSSKRPYGEDENGG